MSTALAPFARGPLLLAALTVSTSGCNDDCPTPEETTETTATTSESGAPDPTAQDSTTTSANDGCDAMNPYGRWTEGDTQLVIESDRYAYTDPASTTFGSLVECVPPADDQGVGSLIFVLGYDSSGAPQFGKTNWYTEGDSLFLCTTSQWSCGGGADPDEARDACLPGGWTELGSATPNDCAAAGMARDHR